MNGIEAIKHMEQGGMVYRIFEDGIVCYRMKLGIVQTKVGATWTVATVFNVLDWYEEYTEPELTGWERVKKDEISYYIDIDGLIEGDLEIFDSVDNRCFNAANYFSTKEKAEEINFKQTLFRKLQRFSDENGGNEIDWKIDRQAKWCIEYNNDNGEIVIVPFHSIMQFGQVYFTSHEVAEQAIQLFHDDLIKYFTTHD